MTMHTGTEHNTVDLMKETFSSYQYIDIPLEGSMLVWKPCGNPRGE